MRLSFTQTYNKWLHSDYRIKYIKFENALAAGEDRNFKAEKVGLYCEISKKLIEIIKLFCPKVFNLVKTIAVLHILSEFRILTMCSLSTLLFAIE